MQRERSLGRGIGACVKRRDGTLARRIAKEVEVERRDEERRIVTTRERMKRAGCRGELVSHRRIPSLSSGR